MFRSTDYKFTTPSCEVLFSSLKTPSKFDENKYNIRCVIDAKYSELIDKTCRQAWEAFNKDNAKKLPYASPLKPLKNQAGEEVPGKLVFKATRNVKRLLSDGKTYVENKVQMFDANGQPIDIEPFGGSEVKLNVFPFPYSKNGNSGISLRLLAVQVIKTGERRKDMAEMDAEDFGFEVGENTVRC
jgi:hypothetical protein